MKYVNGRPVSNAEYKRNQAAYHNARRELEIKLDEGRKKAAEIKLANTTTEKLVTFTSRLWVEEIEEPSNIISFTDPEQDEPLWAVKHKDILSIKVDDIDQDVGPEYKLFDAANGRTILEWIKKHEGENIVVHCEAGISRSAAVTKFLVDHLGYKLDISPKYAHKDLTSYNRYIYRQLDVAKTFMGS